MPKETTIPVTESPPAPAVPTEPVPVKSQAKSEAEAKVAAIEKQKALLKAYADNVGKTFTLGDTSVVLKRFIPSMNVKGKDGPAFLVSTDHALVNVFVNAETFLATYTLKQ